MARLTGILCLLGVTFASAPTAAGFQAPPPSGIGGIITGSILTGTGVENLMTAPICMTDIYGRIVGGDVQKICLVAALAEGVGFTAVGIPVLLQGIHNRKVYKAWRAAQGSLDVPRATIALAVDPDGGGQVVLSGTF
jgi:hypothetical protein